MVFKRPAAEVVQIGRAANMAAITELLIAISGFHFSARLAIVFHSGRRLADSTDAAQGASRLATTLRCTFVAL
jgi:NO-binding membrane sensor protein with MHYT domain